MYLASYILRINKAACMHFSTNLKLVIQGIYHYSSYSRYLLSCAVAQANASYNKLNRANLSTLLHALI